MKACFLLPAHWTGTVGGAEIQVRYIMEALRRRGGVDLYYLCRRTAVSNDEGAHVIKVAGGRLLSKYVYSVDAGPLVGLLKKIRPDVIYVRVDSPYLGIAAWYKRRHDCKLIWHIANERDVQPYRLRSWRSLVRYGDRKLFEYGVRHADVIIGQADYQEVLLQQNFGRSCTEIVPNFHPPPAVRDKRSSPKRVIWVGSIKPSKHPERFLDLARRLQHHDGIEFMMIGPVQDGSWEKSLPEVVSRLANLSYLGELPHEKVVELLGTAHVLVATGELEGFPNVFIEAWLNRAVVVSVEVDPDQVLSEGGLGYLSGNAEQLVNDVMGLVDDEQRWADVAERAYGYALEKHSLRNADRVVAHFFS